MSRDVTDGGPLLKTFREGRLGDRRAQALKEDNLGELEMSFHRTDGVHSSHRQPLTANPAIFCHLRSGALQTTVPEIRYPHIVRLLSTLL